MLFVRALRVICSWSDSASFRVYVNTMVDPSVALLHSRTISSNAIAFARLKISILRFGLSYEDLNIAGLRSSRVFMMSFLMCSGAVAVNAAMGVCVKCVLKFLMFLKLGLNSKPCCDTKCASSTAMSAMFLTLSWICLSSRRNLSFSMDSGVT